VSQTIPLLRPLALMLSDADFVTPSLMCQGFHKSIVLDGRGFMGLSDVFHVFQSGG
jgi:hypothetical protein